MWCVGCVMILWDMWYMVWFCGLCSSGYCCHVGCCGVELNIPLAVCAESSWECSCVEDEIFITTTPPPSRRDHGSRNTDMSWWKFCPDEGWVMIWQCVECSMSTAGPASLRLSNGRRRSLRALTYYTLMGVVGPAKPTYFDLYTVLESSL